MATSRPARASDVRVSETILAPYRHRADSRGAGVVVPGGLCLNPDAHLAFLAQRPRIAPLPPVHLDDEGGELT